MKRNARNARYADQRQRYINIEILAFSFAFNMVKDARTNAGFLFRVGGVYTVNGNHKSSLHFLGHINMLEVKAFP